MENMNLLDHRIQSDAENNGKGDFYKHAAKYWSEIPPTVDGMLGGYGFISNIDIQGSSQFLRLLFKLKVPPGKARALDCGAGIGRITKNLLFNHFDTVDLVEQNPAFVEQARTSLQPNIKMGNFYCSGLQDFIPEPQAYDVIWCQWVLSHLTDEDLTSFLHGCKRGLKRNGLIVIKENTTSSGELDEDPTDSSVTRPLSHLCLLLQSAGLRCVKQKRQEKFPDGLYPVFMIATRPVVEAEESEKISEGCSATSSNMLDHSNLSTPETSDNLPTDSVSNVVDVSLVSSEATLNNVDNSMDET